MNHMIGQNTHEVKVRPKPRGRAVSTMTGDDVAWTKSSIPQGIPERLLPLAEEPFKKSEESKRTRNYDLSPDTYCFAPDLFLILLLHLPLSKDTVPTDSCFLLHKVHLSSLYYRLISYFWTWDPKGFFCLFHQIIPAHLLRNIYIYICKLYHFR